MSAGTLAELVAATPLLVHMLGFLPGFAYMGDLPEVCRAARLATPRTRVPAGSVAVAGRLCAVYPWDSPGGWRIIGRTPLRLFDADNDVRPALLAAGDQVRWRPIDRREFDRVEADVRSGRFDAAELLDRDAAG
jgi:KipI family sensor histidine kinase inhibitor